MSEEIPFGVGQLVTIPEKPVSSLRVINGADTIGRCKNCRHWRKITPRKGCHYSRDTEGGLCQEAGTLDAVDEPISGSDMGVTEKGSLITGPDFGCVQFEARE